MEGGVLTFHRIMGIKKREIAHLGGWGVGGGEGGWSIYIIQQKRNQAGTALLHESEKWRFPTKERVDSVGGGSHKKIRRGQEMVQNQRSRSDPETGGGKKSKKRRQRSSKTLGREKLGGESKPLGGTTRGVHQSRNEEKEGSKGGRQTKGLTCRRKGTWDKSKDLCHYSKKKPRPKLDQQSRPEEGRRERGGLEPRSLSPPAAKGAGRYRFRRGGGGWGLFPLSNKRRVKSSRETETVGTSVHYLLSRPLERFRKR